MLALSGSGNSPNVLHAIAFAKEMGAVTIGLCVLIAAQTTERVAERWPGALLALAAVSVATVTLPLFTQMTQDDVTRVVHAVNEICAAHAI